MIAPVWGFRAFRPMPPMSVSGVLTVMTVVHDLGDWPDFQVGDHVRLPPEPPIGSEFFVRRGAHHGTTVARDAAGWHDNTGPLSWPAVVTMLCAGRDVVFEVRAYPRLCRRRGCGNPISGRQLFCQHSCQTADWRERHRDIK